MQCPAFLKQRCILFLCVSTTLITHSQNITNMQIGVSPLELTLLKFNSQITQHDIKSKNSYICQEQANDNELVIKTVGDTAITTKLTVTEGNRVHSFTVVCLPAIDFNRVSLVYDFSDLKKLKKKVDELNQGVKTSIIPDQQEAPDNTSTIAEEDERAQQAKAAAAKAAKAKAIENARLAKASADAAKAKKIRNALHDSTPAQEAADGQTAERKKKIADSIAALPKFYTHTELWLKYGPSFNFEAPPEGQYLAGDYFIDRDTLENARVSYLILKEQPKTARYSNTVNHISFALQGIYFSGANCYMRILIENKSDGDYLVGPMNVKWYRDSGIAYNAFPCFITSYPSRGLRTSFPVMAAGSEETIVLTTRALNVKEGELLSLTIGDRLNKVKLQLSIPAKDYLTSMEGTR